MDYGNYADYYFECMRTRENDTYAVIGAAMEVHNQLGCGFTEKVYQDALEREFQLQHIPYEREVRMLVMYKGEELQSDFIPDFVGYGKVIVELKAVQELEDMHRAQAINYGKVSGYPIPFSSISVTLRWNMNVSIIPAIPVISPQGSCCINTRMIS